MGINWERMGRISTVSFFIKYDPEEGFLSCFLTWHVGQKNEQTLDVSLTDWTSRLPWPSYQTFGDFCLYSRRRTMSMSKYPYTTPRSLMSEDSSSSPFVKSLKFCRFSCTCWVSSVQRPFTKSPGSWRSSWLSTSRRGRISVGYYWPSPPTKKITGLKLFSNVSSVFVHFYRTSFLVSF